MMVCRLAHWMISHKTLSKALTSLSPEEALSQAGLSSVEQPSIDEVSRCLTYVKQVDSP
jgi:hypothetical protein